MGSPLPTPVSTASSGRPVPGQALDLPATRALAALPQLPSSQGRDSAGFAAIRKAVPLDGSIAPGVPTCLAPAPTQVLSLRPSPREKKTQPHHNTKPNQQQQEKKGQWLSQQANGSWPANLATLGAAWAGCAPRTGAPPCRAPSGAGVLSGCLGDQTAMACHGASPAADPNVSSAVPPAPWVTVRGTPQPGSGRA